MKEIKFENRVLVSTYEPEKPFHDDMIGENVWVNTNYNPFNNDWRHFNGIPIGRMAKIIERYDEKKTSLEIDFMKDIHDARI